MRRSLSVLLVLSAGLAIRAQPPTVPIPAKAGDPDGAASTTKVFETGVAAYVNRDVITHAEVWKKLRLRRHSFSDLPEEKRRSAFAGELIGMIADKVWSDGAARLQLVVPDQWVKSQIELEKEGMSAQDFQKSLAEKGFIDEREYMDQKRAELGSYVYLQTQTGRMKALGLALRPEHVVEPTAAEVRAYYLAHLENEFKRVAETKIRVIALPISKYGGEGSPEDRAQRTLEFARTLKQELATGADFATLATTYGEVDQKTEGLSTAGRGRGPGWHTPESPLSPPQLLKYGFEAPIGQVSEPIPLRPEAAFQLQRGFCLAVVEAREDARTIPFSEAQHTIRKALKDIAVARASAAVKLRLIKDAYIKPDVYKLALIRDMERGLQQ